MLHLAIVNGANLNLIGVREPHIYGDKSLSRYIDGLKHQFPAVQMSQYQSNVEGELINYLQGCIGRVQGIIINPGSYSHTSIALADALASISIPAIEVHISNIYARESFRAHSYTAAKCIGCVTGLGLEGYKLAIQYLVGHLQA